MRNIVAIALQEPEIVSDLVREKTATTRYLGAWGAIESNRKECIDAIVTAVRYFGGDDESKTILFACHKDDVGDICRAIREAVGACDLRVVGEIGTN